MAFLDEKREGMNSNITAKLQTKNIHFNDSVSQQQSNQNPDSYSYVFPLTLSKFKLFSVNDFTFFCILSADTE